MPRKNGAVDDVVKELREFGLRFPGAHLKSPWPGHLDLAVKDKTFAYLSLEGEPLDISCKLPQSNVAALMLPFTKPTAYGLGKSGWVTAQFARGQKPPVEMLKAWIEESYRAQAPKKLLAGLPTAQPPATPSRPPAPRQRQAASSRQQQRTAARARPPRRPRS
jgi:predicted DNA-binding protein (MmcQ/YjbR family)